MASKTPARQRISCFGTIVLVLCAGFVLAKQAGAETYLAAELGWNFPSSRDVELNGTPRIGPPLAPGTSSTGLELKHSLMYGAKLGHYLADLPWLGVETELFNTAPHEKQQFLIRTEPAGAGCPAFRDCVIAGVSPGFNLRVLTWALNLVVRYPGGRFQPYAGAGVGLFFAHRTDGVTGSSQSSTQPGLNTQLGLRYLLTKHLGLFGEWKYNYARFTFAETDKLFGTDYTYHAHMLALGVSYSF